MAKTGSVASTDSPVAIAHAADHFLKPAMPGLRRKKDAKSMLLF